MKNIIIMLSLILSLIACSSKSNTVRDFIPGTYARFSDHEMRKEFDTLKIEAVTTESNSYRLIRTSSFQKKLDGHAFPWEHSEEEWAAVYDENKQVLNETKKGKVISFVPEKNILLVGTTEYKKIK